MISAAPRSIGCATDLMIARFDGSVEERGDCWVLRTPANPKYFFGNCLVFKDAPSDENALPDGPRSWERTFDAELGRTAYGGRLFVWDRTQGERGAADAFVARGYENDDGYALTGSRLVKPPTFRPDIEVRPVEGDREWGEAEELCRESFSEHAHGDLEGQREFVTLQFRRYRRWAAAGLGTYFGARIGGELCGAAGLFGVEGLYRYQLVATHPSFRKQGVCATLVHGAGMHALSAFGARTLVILAAVDYHAWRVYQSVGLEPTERIPAVRLRSLGQE